MTTAGPGPATTTRRLAAVLAAGVVPWLVVVATGPASSTSLVFSFGLVSLDPLHLTTLPTYLLVLTRGLPASLVAWPVASLLWALAAVSGAAGRLAGREDPRVTGGLLVLAGLSLLPVAGAVGRPAAVVALPAGTAACWLVAWWGYRGALVRAVTSGGPARGR